MKIALVENFGSDFVGARLRFAVFLKEKGIEVTAIIPQDGHREFVENRGIGVIEVGANIRGNGIKNKFEYAKQLKQILKKESFDIVHFYRLQPNIIGTFIAGIYTKSKIVNHVTGLGVAFTNKSSKNRLFQFVIKFLYKFNNVCFRPYTIYQNKHDSFDLGIQKRAICIEGSAVNESKFYKELALKKQDEILSLKSELKIPIQGAKVFLFVSRLLKEKGILQLIDGFIKAQNETDEPIYLVLVGWSDSENPSSVKPKELEALIKNYNNILFLGKRSDVDLLVTLSDVCILPTYYREGTPRFLLEAMALGKAIITTDMPGCDHLIENNENGQLIEPKSVDEIKNSILKIIDRDLVKLGIKSNELYHNKFSEKRVYSSILNLYESILK
ncbi:MAG: glycosyltransferase [Lutibacter sp.]|uniref:glycosyltransferase n=1 Tax=Lutibacter sp. TaxID=1925666 RepID=UPI00299DAC23|nr:glycosyltransferase [Lutibacter sp.]MDX1828790.1 glycosyltransferase [Lutibacter sp.]